MNFFLTILIIISFFSDSQSGYDSSIEEINNMMKNYFLIQNKNY